VCAHVPYVNVAGIRPEKTRAGTWRLVIALIDHKDAATFVLEGGHSVFVDDMYAEDLKTIMARLKDRCPRLAGAG